MQYTPVTLYLNSGQAFVANGVYRWDLTDPFLSSFSNFTVAVVRMTLPNLVYPISAGRLNNKVYVKENGGATLTGTIPDNNYNGTQFATALQTMLNAAPFTLVYTVTFNTQSLKLTISVAAGTIQLITGTNNAYYEMGFYTLPTANAASLTGDYTVELQGTNYVEVIANFVSSASIASSLSAGVAAVIPMDSGFGSVVFYDPQTPNHYLTAEGYLSNVVVSFKDDKQNQWIPPPNVLFNMVLQITPSNLQAV
jgi:hypothetical protein